MWMHVLSKNLQQSIYNYVLYSVKHMQPESKRCPLQLLVQYSTINIADIGQDLPVQPSHAIAKPIEISRVGIMAGSDAHGTGPA